MVSANLATYTPTFLPNLAKYLPPIGAPDFFFIVYIKARKQHKLAMNSPFLATPFLKCSVIVIL